MFANVAQTEPLPLYSPRQDPDAASIHSAAPSYVSDTPTYTSRRLSNTAPSAPSSRSLLPPVSPDHQTRGLPAADFAPGFQSRRHGSVSDLNQHTFNQPSWSSTRTGHHSRQYEAVARRRASQAVTRPGNASATLNSLGTSPYPANGSPNVSSSHLNAYPPTVGSSSDPISPLEDPYLVGEEAARRARTQRIYREMCLREEEAARQEGASWEFMIVQMADWEERGQSWKNSRTRAGQSKLLGRLGSRA